MLQKEVSFCLFKINVLIRYEGIKKRKAEMVYHLGRKFIDRIIG